MNRGFWHGAAVHSCARTRGARPKAGAHRVGTRGRGLKLNLGKYNEELAKAGLMLAAEAGADAFENS